MKIDFILTVRVLLSNLWDTSLQPWGMSQIMLLAVLYRAGVDTFGASAELQKHVSLGG